MGRFSDEMLTVAIDFDGTITESAEYSTDMELILRPGMDILIQWLHARGVDIILWTSRTEGEKLNIAKNFLKDKGLLHCFCSFNTPNSKVEFQTSQKVYADLYIDDLALGFHLITEKGLDISRAVLTALQQDKFLKSNCYNNNPLLDFEMYLNDTQNTTSLRS